MYKNRLPSFETTNLNCPSSDCSSLTSASCPFLAITEEGIDGAVAWPAAIVAVADTAEAGAFEMLLDSSAPSADEDDDCACWTDDC